MSKQKTVLLGVTGGIAAYKMAYVASGLKQRGYAVSVVMTKHATEFITPLTFEALTGGPVYTDMFDPATSGQIPHIALSKAADLVLIAPATANVIAKLAHGIADDLLTSTMLACTCPMMVAPAMNTHMYENAATQANLRVLKERGVQLIDPAFGRLACGDVGAGKMPEPAVLIDYVEQALHCEKDMAGLSVLVTAGPTREAIDPVRFITNHSSGKMGYALAVAAARRGAQVTLVSGPTALEKPLFVNTIEVESAAQMYDAVIENAPKADIVIKAAAVADYRPAFVASEKIKKTEGTQDSVVLERTDDILAALGAMHGKKPFLCGFSMETENVLANSRKKLEKKQLDMIVANSLRQEGAGFGGDTNIVTLITAEEEQTLPLLSKEETAHRILDAVLHKQAQH